MSDRSSNIKLSNTTDLEVNPATEDKQDVIIDNQTNGEQKTQVVDSDGNTVSVQYPLPTDGDSVYAKDIDDDEHSTIGTFTGTLASLFDDYDIEITDVSNTNPKTFTIQFLRPIRSSFIGLGSGTGNFSNVKISLKDLSGTTRIVIDDSTNNTKYTSNLYPFSPNSFLAMVVEFHTTDTVKINGMTISKDIGVVARLQAIKPNGNVTNIGSTNNDNLKVSVQEYGDTPSIDAFDRLRVSNPITLFDSKQLHDKAPLFWDESIGGNATSVHSSVNAATTMTVTASASDYVIRQTKQRFNYQPGKSQLILFTFYGSQVAGLTKKAGLFDGTGINNLTANNGIFFETNGDVSWNIAKNGTTTETVIQSDWNVDKLDGTGPSGIAMDFNATQIGIVDFEWLGVGRVRVGFVLDGIIYYTHYFNHANNPAFTSVYMSSPNLPVRYSIESDGSAAGSFDHICSTVMSEGGIQETGVLRSIDTGTTHLDANTADTTYALIGTRLKSTHLDITVTPTALSMISETNDDFRWSLHLNPTVAGIFTYSDMPNSALQEAKGITANNITDEGIVITSGYAQSNASPDISLETALRMGSTIAGITDTLVLCVTPLSSNADIQGSLVLRELL